MLCLQGASRGDPYSVDHEFGCTYTDFFQALLRMPVYQNLPAQLLTQLGGLTPS